MLTRAEFTKLMGAAGAVLVTSAGASACDRGDKDDHSEDELVECDVAVIGAGIAGSAVSRELARYDLSVVVLEAGNDVACGATRANSGIVHAGFDPEPGTLKARYNVAGAAAYPRWAQELNFAYWPNGALVLAFSAEERGKLEELLARGEKNGVEGLSIIGADEVRELEPNVASDVVAGLLAPSSAVVDPYGVARASMENAITNGASLYLNRGVAGIEAVEDGFELECSDGARIRARAVVNAAGTHSGEVYGFVSDEAPQIMPRRGEYLLYRPDASGVFSHTMFQTPTDAGKGVLVSPVVFGNTFIGPTATGQESLDDVSTTRNGVESLVESAKKVWQDASFNGVMTSYAGLRAKGADGDFIIGEAEDAPGFFNILCFDSPGLSAAPAVAEELAAEVAKSLGAGERDGFEPTREASGLFAMMDDTARSAAIADDAAFGRIVCRCCNVTEAEIKAELHGVIPALTLDAVKWRCGAMMGPCHGSRCAPRIAQIVADELGISPDELEGRRAGAGYVASAGGEAVIKTSEGADAKASAAPGLDGRVFDLVVVGGGVAGLKAAADASAGGSSVALIERDAELGGVLADLAHAAFGDGGDLDGPTHIATLVDKLADAELFLNTAVTGLTRLDDGSIELSTVGEGGVCSVQAASVVLATGMRSRGFGELLAVGSRPSGIYSAEEALRLMNRMGCRLGNKVVVAYDGDDCRNVADVVAARLVETGSASAETVDGLPSEVMGTPRITGVVVDEATYECDGLVFVAEPVAERALYDGLEDVQNISLVGGALRPGYRVD